MLAEKESVSSLLAEIEPEMSRVSLSVNDGEGLEGVIRIVGVNDVVTSSDIVLVPLVEPERVALREAVKLFDTDNSPVKVADSLFSHDCVAE